MDESTFWWIATGVLVALELVTGTFYLLLLALGMAAGAIAAHLGLGTSMQMVAAAVVGGGAVAIWYGLHHRQPQGGPSSANQDVNLDIGGTVQVDSWSSDRTATVKYRGADWTAELGTDAVAVPGTHRIVEIVGSRLIVSPVK